MQFFLGIFILLEWMSWNLKNRNEVWNESTLFLLEILVICVGDLCLAGSRSTGFHPSAHHWLSEMRVLMTSVCRFHPPPPCTCLERARMQASKGTEEDRGRLVSSSSMWWEIHGCCSAYWHLLSRQRSESIPRCKGRELTQLPSL